MMISVCIFFCIIHMHCIFKMVMVLVSVSSILIGFENSTDGEITHVYFLGCQ